MIDLRNACITTLFSAALVPGLVASASAADFYAGKQVNFLIQMGLSKHPDLPNVPNVLDMLTSKLDREAVELLLAPSEMGRPFVAPPGVPADRLALLRTAFTSAMNDPAFKAEAAKQKMEINPMTGAEVEVLVKRIYTTASPETVARAMVLTSDGVRKKKKKKN